MQKSARAGFTLLELLLFTGIFSFLAISFVSITVVVSQSYSRQGAAAEVNRQSKFLLDAIEGHVEQASLVELSENSATTTLRLRMASSSVDPTLIYLDGTTVYLAKAGGAPEPLTTNKVNVTDLTFVKHSNAPGRDSVSVSFTVVYNTTNPQRAFSRSLEGAVARVNAATFDSNIVPNVADTYKIGVATEDWQSINNTIFFNGTNVGIGAGATTPNQTLQLDGGLRLSTTNTKPTCNSSQRGTLWYTQSGAGTADGIERCYKDAADAYAWSSLVGSSAGTVNASSVAPGVFATSTGNFAFRQSLGIATSSEISLPQELSVQGDAYFSGNVGIGIANPLSALHVPDGSYAQLGNFGTSSPPSGDCDSDTEIGRIYLRIDSGSAVYTIYICMGASRGWDSETLTD